MIIRKARAPDQSGVVECLRAAFAPYTRSYTPQAFRDTVLDESTVSGRFEAMTIFIAEHERVVVGTIGCQQTDSAEGHLRGMGVRPEWQGSVVAHLLLSAAELELASRGCARVTLDTTQPLERAMRFYEKHGYRRTGRTAEFFGMLLYEFAKSLE
ncbi:MAG TPA: GNAT family N-acetyltransferase [Thermoanaerobaculia bacterium]